MLFAAGGIYAGGGSFFIRIHSVDRVSEVIEGNLENCFIDDQVDGYGQRIAFAQAGDGIVGVVEGDGHAARVRARGGHRFLHIAAACGYIEDTISTESLPVLAYGIVRACCAVTGHGKTRLAAISELQRSERAAVIHPFKSVTLVGKRNGSLPVDVGSKGHAHVCKVEGYFRRRDFDIHIVIGGDISIVVIIAHEVGDGEHIGVCDSAYGIAHTILIHRFERGGVADLSHLFRGELAGAVLEPMIDVGCHIPRDGFGRFVAVGHRYGAASRLGCGEGEHCGGDFHIRMRNVRHEFARAVVVAVAAEDDHGEVVAHVGGGGSAVYARELIARI